MQLLIDHKEVSFQQSPQQPFDDFAAELDTILAIEGYAIHSIRRFPPNAPTVGMTALVEIQTVEVPNVLKNAVIKVSEFLGLHAKRTAAQAQLIEAGQFDDDFETLIRDWNLVILLLDGIARMLPGAALPELPIQRTIELLEALPAFGSKQAVSRCLVELALVCDELLEWVAGLVEVEDNDVRPS